MFSTGRQEPGSGFTCISNPPRRVVTASTSLPSVSSSSNEGAVNPGEGSSSGSLYSYSPSPYFSMTLFGLQCHLCVYQIYNLLTKLLSAHGQKHNVNKASPCLQDSQC